MLKLTVLMPSQVELKVYNPVQHSSGFHKKNNQLVVEGCITIIVCHLVLVVVIIGASIDFLAQLAYKSYHEHTQPTKRHHNAVLYLNIAQSDPKFACRYHLANKYMIYTWCNLNNS